MNHALSDFVVAYLFGLVFYATLFPLLISIAKRMRLAAPWWLITVARWLLCPAGLLALIVGVLSWESGRVWATMATYYAHSLFRVLKVQRGAAPSDELIAMSLYLVAHPEVREFLEHKDQARRSAHRN